MPAPATIIDLVQRFADNAAEYRAGHYNETQLRREFLDPFFEALGWDVNNRQGYAEAYKDVIHEDAHQDGRGHQGAGLRFPHRRRAQVLCRGQETVGQHQGRTSPRPSNCAATPGRPSCRLRILTDFEEFAVYDCRGKPDKNDKAATGRVMYLTYDQYAEKWDEIAAIFSREAVLKGSFDRYAEATKGKRGTADVDDAFLAEIERWRDLLARNIALRNPDLSPARIELRRADDH